MKKSELQQLAEHYRDFIEEAVRCGSAHTVKSHKVAMQLYLRYLEQVRKVKPEDFSVNHFDEPIISKYLNWLCDVNGCKAQTCNVRLASIRAFLRYAARKDASMLWLYAKASAIKLRKDMNPKVVRPLSQDTINALVKAAGTDTESGLKYSTLMVFLYTTATRLDEVLSIKIGELHMEQVPAHVTVIGKGRVSRTLFLPERLLKYLRKYIAMQHGHCPDPEALLFFSKHKGNKVKQSEEGVNKQLRKYAAIAHASCKDVPLDLHSHQFRHSAATHALENNMSVFQISKMLGHKSVTTTMAYLGITPKIREDAVRKIESSLQVCANPIWKGKTSAIQAAFWLVNEIRTLIICFQPIIRCCMIFVRIYNLFGFLVGGRASHCGIRLQCDSAVKIPNNLREFCLHSQQEGDIIGLKSTRISIFDCTDSIYQLRA